MIMIIIINIGEMFWFSCNAFASINDVFLYVSRSSVLGSVTVWSAGEITSSICNQLPRSTQPGHPSVVGTTSTSESRDLGLADTPHDALIAAGSTMTPHQ